MAPPSPVARLAQFRPSAPISDSLAWASLSVIRTKSLVKNLTRLLSERASNMRRKRNMRSLYSFSTISFSTRQNENRLIIGNNIIGSILWGHSGPLCHALSLSLWTSIVTGSVRRLAVANGPSIFQLLLVVTVNVALQRRAVQISTYSTKVASLAVDGSLSTASCTHYDTSTQPWWSVDLGSPMAVARVTVTNEGNPTYGQLYRISSTGVVWGIGFTYINLQMSHTSAQPFYLHILTLLSFVLLRRDLWSVSYLVLLQKQTVSTCIWF